MNSRIDEVAREYADLEVWNIGEGENRMGGFLGILRAFKCSGMVKACRHGNDELDVANGMAKSQVHGQANGIKSDHNPGGMDSTKDPLTGRN